MALAHNCLIRGLNAIIQQAPWVPDSSSPLYKTQDVKDLLFFVVSWVKMVHHHHWVEETYMFGAMDELAGKPGLMDDSKHQHEAFHDGMAKLQSYAETTKPEEYRWEGTGGMREIVDSFGKALTEHLDAEIDVILGFKDLGMDSTGLKKIWDKGEELAKQNGNIGMLVSNVSDSSLFYFAD
jgi:hemerythrin-like domain-containing protein